MDLRITEMMRLAKTYNTSPTTVLPLQFDPTSGLVSALSCHESLKDEIVPLLDGVIYRRGMVDALEVFEFQQKVEKSGDDVPEGPELPTREIGVIVERVLDEMDEDVRDLYVRGKEGQPVFITPSQEIAILLHAVQSMRRALRANGIEPDDYEAKI